MQAMLPKLALTEAATLQLAPLLAPQKAAERVAAAATASEIKRMVDELPMLLSNRSKGLQGEISRHQAEVKQERYVKSMPMGTAEQKARKCHAKTRVISPGHLSHLKLNVQRLITTNSYTTSCIRYCGM